MASAGNIRAGGAFVEIFAQDGKFQQAMTRIQNRLRETGKNIQQFGTGMALGAGAVGAPMLLALRQFTQYDDAIRAARAVTGSLGKEGEAAFGRMNDKARELGASTSFTAVQVANLMTELGRAGFSPDQINEMTLAVLDLARATGTDATLSAGIMAATLRQFDMGAGSAARVADVLTMAANKTFNSVETLGEAMKYAGPVAADLGMSLEDTAAILGTLGNVGIQGSMAGTTLRRLGVITAAEGDKLQQIFGVAFKDAAGNARPLVDVLGEVAAATNALPTAERAKKFSDAFGLLGITGASAIGKVAADTRQLKKDLEGAAGTARATAKEMDAGLGGSMRILLSAIEGVALAFGDAIAPAAQMLANAATRAADAIRALVKQFPLASQLAAGLVGGLFVLGAAAIVTGFSLQVLGSSIGVAAKAIPLLATPMGLATAAVVGGVAIMLAAAYQLSPAFRTEADAIMAALGRLDFASVWEIMNLNLSIALVRMTQLFEGALTNISHTVVATASFIGDKLTEGVERSLEALGMGIDSGRKAASRNAGRKADEADRQKENDARNQGYEATIGMLRDDLSRARDRAAGKKPAEASADTKPVAVEVSRPVAVTASPGSPPGEQASTAASGGTLGTFSDSVASRIGAGPSLTAAQQTAENTQRTADGVEQLLRGDNGLGNVNGAGNTDGVGNVMGVGNESGVLGNVPAATAVVPPLAPAAPVSPLDALAGMITKEDIRASFEGAGISEAGARAGQLLAATDPAAAVVPPADPAAHNRLASAAMPAAASSPPAGDKELLTVAERHANLAQQMVEHLQKIVENTKGGGIAFA
jgi:TP901 family phage tail tape measure protein